MQTGKKTVQVSLQCFVLHAKDSGTWRCTIVVPTSTDKRAVVRNRIKRLISESMARLSPELSSGTDIVFLVKKGFHYESQKYVNEQVHSLLRSAGLSTES